jgi:hypothetical protein
MMRQRFAPWGLAALGLAALGCRSSGGGEPSLVPAQTVQMDSDTLEKFAEEVEEYVELRKSVLTHIPPVTPKSTADELSARQRSLTQAIVAYRKGKKRGNIFRKDVEAAIRRTLAKEFTGPDGPALIKAVKQGNPKVEGNPVPNDPTKEVKPPVTLAVNAVYPDAAPFSTVPPSLLLKLPQLPEEVRFRFVGRALILRDTEANVILDFIPDVVPDPTIPR